MSSSILAVRVVVLTGGPQIDHQVLTFVDRLEQDPAIDLVAVFSESPLRGVTGVLTDLWRRRGILALPLMLQRGLSAGWQRIHSPATRRAYQRILGRLATRIRYVNDLHDPAVLARVRELRPDLGLVYGGPIVKAELFDIPRLGTLGIHHGKVPEYRGKKTTFWAIYNGEKQVGVTIQRIDDQLDGGDVVAQTRVDVARRPLPAVKKHLEQVGIDLYLQAVRTVRDGSANYTPQPQHRRKLYKDPGVADIVRFWFRYLISLLCPAPYSSSRARVCLLTETFHPITGGGETQAKALALGLSDLGETVQVITRRTSLELAKLEFMGPVTVRRLGPSGPGPGKKWAFSFIALVSLLRLARTYDAILVCGFRVLGIPAITAGWLLRKPCILKADLLGEHDGAIFQRRLNRFGDVGYGNFTRWLLALRARALAHANRFVAISSPVEEELVDGGVERQKIVHIPNSVNTDLFRPVDALTKTQLRQRLGIANTKHVAIYTGRLETTKGLPTLLKAWQTVIATNPNVQLLLVGSGGIGAHNCEADLREYVTRHGLQKRVTFAGSVHNVHQYLQACDVFVFPTEREAFGISVIEAMACGLPVVTTNPGGLADVVSNGETALVVPVNDASALARTVAQVMDGGFAELGAAGRLSVEHRYAQTTVLKQYRDLLSEVIGPVKHLT